MTEVDKRHGNLLSLYKMSFKCIKSISEHVSFSIALNYIFFIILLYIVYWPTYVNQTLDLVDLLKCLLMEISN